jgi:membrane-associated phospholipid phosphatase
MIDLVKKIIRLVRTFIREKFHTHNPELPYYITILLAIVFFAGAMKGFIELTDQLVENQLGGFDELVTQWILQFRSDGLTAFFRFVTDLGDRYAYIIISFLLAAYFYYKHKTWTFILQTVSVLLLATFTNVLLKRVIHRERPSLEHLVNVYTLSYPSGHAMGAMAFYGFLIYLCFQLKMNAGVRVLLTIVLALLIVSIGTSRIYLGVHYPSDVLAGFIGGFLWVTLCITIFNVFYLLRKRSDIKRMA